MIYLEYTSNWQVFAKIILPVLCYSYMLQLYWVPQQIATNFLAKSSKNVAVEI